MTRLELLYQERELVKNLYCMCFDLKEKAAEYYSNEIRTIEEFGSPNPEIKLADKKDT